MTTWFGLFAALIGLLVGSVATSLGQIVVARRKRLSEVEDAQRETVRELLAASDLVVGQNETVWQVVYAIGRGDDRSRDVFKRSLDGWERYLQARAAIRLSAPASVDALGTELREALVALTDAVAFYYYGTPADCPSDEQMDEFRRRVHTAQQEIEAQLNKELPLPKRSNEWWERLLDRFGVWVDSRRDDVGR